MKKGNWHQEDLEPVPFFQPAPPFSATGISFPAGRQRAGRLSGDQVNTEVSVAGDFSDRFRDRRHLFFQILHFSRGIRVTFPERFF